MTEYESAIENNAGSQTRKHDAKGKGKESVNSGTDVENTASAADSHLSPLPTAQGMSLTLPAGENSGLLNAEDGKIKTILPMKVAHVHILEELGYAFDIKVRSPIQI